MRLADDGRSGPRWRAILEARWRIRLQEVTELSLAYHAVTADASAGTEDALGRLAAGGFGRCEQCGALIPEVLLAGAPESRYCARCAAGAVRGSVGAGTMAARR